MTATKNFRVRVADSSQGWAYDEEIKLIWTDPPYGTGKVQRQGGRSYRDPTPLQAADLCMEALGHMIPLLAPDGVVCVCADYRIVHDLAYRLSQRGLFLQGEIIWTFGLGRPRTSWWPNRHNTILTFTLSEMQPPFRSEAVPRELRKAPKRGYEGDKPAGSVWDFTLSNTDPERVGYPNQKPLAVIEPFVLAHTEPGDVVADPFMGSGSTGVAALRNGRRFQGQEKSRSAKRLAADRMRETLR